MFNKKIALLLLSSVCLVSASDLESTEDSASSTGFFSKLFSGKKTHDKKMHQENKMHADKMHAAMHSNQIHANQSLDKAIREAETRKNQGRVLQRRDSFRALEAHRGPEGMADIKTPGQSSQVMEKELKAAKNYTRLLEQDNRELQKEIRDLRALVQTLDSKNADLTNRLLEALEWVGR